MTSHPTENGMSTVSLTKAEMKHLGKMKRKELNISRISTANIVRLVDQLPVDEFILSVPPERKPVTLIDFDCRKPLLNVGDFVAVDEDYSAGIFRPYGCGFIVGHDGRNRVSSYSVKYTPGYDNGRTHGKIPLSACTRRSYSDSYFGVNVGRSKVRNCVNIVTPEKKKLVGKKDIVPLSPTQKLVSELIDGNSKKKEKDGDEKCWGYLNVILDF